MRTLADFYLYSRTQAEHVRVRVADSGGTLRDVCTYPGFNALKSVQWGEKVNDATGVATVTLFREQGLLSLSPWMASSALNKGFDPAGAYNPLIALNRVFVVEMELRPADKPETGVLGPSAVIEVFRGRIDQIDPAAGDTVTFTGRDLAGRLAEQHMKYERVYSLADDSGLVSLRQWAPDTIFNAGDYCLPAKRGSATSTAPADPGENKFFVLTAGGGGASGLTEPVWTTGAGISDGALTWAFVDVLSTGGHAVAEIIQNILDDNVQSGDSAVGLYAPVDPGWAIKEYQQDRTFTLDACRNLARQCGGDTRMKWDPGTGAFRFTFWFPDRTASAPLHTFAADDYSEPSAMPIDKSIIRNSWRGIYTDPTVVLSDGKSLARKQVEVQDPASIAKYGELWAEIQEDASSQIDTETEMLAMLNSALADCSEPTTQLSIELVRGFPYCELGDLYRFTADGLRFSSDFDLAVSGYQQTWSGGRLKTRLELRGKPSIGNDVWMQVSVGPFLLSVLQSGQYQQQSFSGQKTASTTITPKPGGAHLVVSEDVDKLARETFYEHHIYSSSGATLSAATLHTVSKSRDTEVGHLYPGATYYHRLVSRWLDG